jgi:hypothetical protein
MLNVKCPLRRGQRMNIRKVTGIPVIAVALLSCSFLVRAQAAPAGGPPTVLQIFREEVKQGKAPAHEVMEAGWPRAFARANWPTHYLAMTSLTGPSEAWFMTGYDSFAAWEADSRNIDKNAGLKKELDQLEAKDGELRSGGRSIVASLRGDLSNQPNVDMPKMRYFRVITIRLKPGHDAQFPEAIKILKAGYDKANLTLPWAIYQISSGMAVPTFLVFIPMKSLDEVDLAVSRSKTLQEAQGEENAKKLQAIAADAYFSVDSNIFAFNPNMSYPSKEWAAADPEFWKPKAADAMKPEGKKPAAGVEKKGAKP